MNAFEALSGVCDRRAGDVQALGCIRCDISKEVWLPPPTNRNMPLEPTLEPFGAWTRSSLHETLRLWNGSDRLLTGNDIRRCWESGIYFEDVACRNREGWASAEQPA